MKTLLGTLFLASLAPLTATAAEPDSRAERDFATFMYTLNLAPGSDAEKFSEPLPSRLYQLAQREMSAEGTTAPELYAKFQQVLDRIQPSLKKLYAANQAILGGQFNREVRCLELSATAGFCVGASLTLSIGLVHVPHWSYPTFGFRLRRMRSGIPDEIMGMGHVILGLFTEIGMAASRRSPDQSDFKNFEVENSNRFSSEIAALAAGGYRADYSNGKKSRGLAFGLGFGSSYVTGIQAETPLKIPLYYFNYEKPLLKTLHSFVQALYIFDFESAEVLAQEFTTKTELALKKLQNRGLILSQESTQATFPEHPLHSPGRLFHPRTVLRYAPKELIPANLVILDCEKAASQKGPSLLGLP